MLEKISKRKSSFLREEYGREVMGEAARWDLAERLRSAEATRASDAQEYRRNLAAAETQLEEERARRARTEADLANQEMEEARAHRRQDYAGSDLRSGKECPACGAGIRCEWWECRSHGGRVVDWWICRSFLECGSAIAKIKKICISFHFM